MFKLNRMTDYAIVVLVVLAHRQGKILATAQLAGLTGLNQTTVAKVAKTLVSADLLDTQRGVHGGYVSDPKHAAGEHLRVTYIVIMRDR